MSSSPKVLPRLPRGLVDRQSADLKAAERMLAKIRETYELYGFDGLETPLIEFTDALGKFLPDQDRPNAGVFSFQDEDEQWLSLRYDLTAPLARFAAENWDKLPKPYRSYRNGWVFRNEKPGPGRYRQFMQFDADIVGAASVAADAEMAMLMADTLEAVGLKRGQYVIKVNNRKVLDGVLEAIGLAGDDRAAQRLTVLRGIDKLDKFGPEGVALLLGAGRKDESGDFTPGAGLDRPAIDRVLGFLAAGRDTAAATVEALAGLVAETACGRDGADELRQIAEMVATAGYADRVKIDPSVVRGLEYYTGPVYEAELTFEVPNDDGQIVRFGSVGGGGRYDGLVSRFLPEPVPATGFSIGVSRLLAALKAVKSPILAGAEGIGPVVVLVMDRDRLGDYQALAATLRGAGIRAEVYLGASGMKAQMKYADRRDAPCVIIQGSNERDAGVVQIKDLKLGKELSASISDNKEWRESRPAQQTVPTPEMVAAVRRIVGGA
jgi:histidyl-tRNA synthetase